MFDIFGEGNLIAIYCFLLETTENWLLFFFKMFPKFLNCKITCQTDTVKSII